MDIQALQIPFRFSGAAGRLQESQQTAGLIAELGDNYENYHGELAAAVESLRVRPSPEDYEGDFAGYQAANQRWNDLLSAERAVRLCAVLRRRAARRDLVYQVPLVDGRHRLVNALGYDPSTYIQPTAPRPPIASQGVPAWPPSVSA